MHAQIVLTISFRPAFIVFPSSIES